MYLNYDRDTFVCELCDQLENVRGRDCSLFPLSLFFFSFSMALSHGIGSLPFCSFSDSFFLFLRFISADFHSSLFRKVYFSESKRQSMGDIFLSLCSVVRSPLSGFVRARLSRMERVREKARNESRLRESLELLWNDSDGFPL